MEPIPSDPAALAEAVAVEKAALVEEILETLSVPLAQPPKLAFELADQHRDALISPLLGALAVGVSGLGGRTEADALRFSHALYLLAKWREAQALPLVLCWLRLPAEEAFDLGGDIVTEAGGRILASVCGGQLEGIHKLIEDPKVHGACRAQGLLALCCLVAWGELSREDLAAYLESLCSGKLEREASEVWDEIAAITVDLGLTTLRPAILRTFDEGLVRETFISHKEFEQELRAGRGLPASDFKTLNAPITDVAAETGWWAQYSEPIRRLAEKIGRNDPCSCQSGKKYKKCCGKAG